MSSHRQRDGPIPACSCVQLSSWRVVSSASKRIANLLKKIAEAEEEYGKVCVLAQRAIGWIYRFDRPRLAGRAKGDSARVHQDQGAD